MPPLARSWRHWVRPARARLGGDGRERLAHVAAELARSRRARPGAGGGTRRTNGGPRGSTAPTSPMNGAPDSVGGSVVTRGDPEWPQVMADLGDDSAFRALRSRRPRT